MEHPYGALSVVPPLLAITLAIVTRRIVLSLLVAVSIGSLILSGGNPVAALVATCETFLWQSLSDPSHLRVFGFTFLMGAMVGVIHRAGGLHALVEVLSGRATTRRRGQLVGWLLGLVVFFDDYANTLLLGGTLRPLMDRLRISREKLAYIVDATAAPVAGLAVVSTWVATEIALIDTGYRKAGLAGGDYSAFDIFVETIPYRFYPIFALALVGLVAATRRDFGPMLEAESGARSGQPSPRPFDELEESPALRHDSLASSHWLLAIGPVLVVVAGVLILLYATGNQKSPRDTSLWQTISQGDSYVALFYASALGLAAAVGAARLWRVANTRQLREAALVGGRMMLPALVILWLAWALAAQVGPDDPRSPGARLDAATYLGGGLSGGLSAPWIPTITFLLASLVAFSTGTSWGTMTILMPLVIDTTYRVLLQQQGSVAPADPILLASVGSVLSGAIFGDHCSPISDTTILSSRASGCDHLAHVWTQLPYALLGAVATVLLGTVPAGFGVPVWWLLPCGIAAMALFLRLRGRVA